ncbi:hypothetical protein F5Y10DRAFT_289738 [Nemania abortiva]|nr:hypothetical protein F5Y10DRAFT_289738 [Nemania abortiva]
MQADFFIIDTMPVLAFEFRSPPAVAAFEKEHNIPTADIFQLAYAVVLHQFFDIDSYIFLEDLSSRTNGYYSQTQSLFKFEPDLSQTTTVLAALRRGLSPSEKTNAASSVIRCIPFSTLDDTQKADSRFPYLIILGNLDSVKLTENKAAGLPEHDFTIIINISSSSARAIIKYQSHVHSKFQVENIARALNQALQSIVECPDQLVSDLNLLSVQDQLMIEEWNKEETQPEQACLHQLVERTAERYPDKTALISWDGQLTYKQLNSLANRLASHLTKAYKLNVGMKVPLCFEKSSWAVVAMLGVLKAGGATCCLDPGHPRARHDFIIKSIQSSFIITSPIHQDLFRGHANVLLLDSEFIARLPDAHETVCSTVSPSDTCLIAFTSGSTGVPKGIVHTHTTVCTGLVESAPREGLDRPDVRVFQWAAYTFDVALTEIYAPLIHGGCICIPSEDERLNDVEGAMNRMRCEWAFFTPTFSRFFRRYNVPTLKTIAMGGEAAMDDDINAWVDRVKVLHVFGPAECITWFIKTFNEPSPKTISFGRLTNAHGWVVDPNNPERLLPVGAVGELLIEGPAVFVEYLNDAVRTAASFIRPPSWRQSIGAPCTNRIYKSGDLVRYLPNGEMMYVGRKDAMVKLRGQRIDLNEIEHLLRVSLEGIADVAVDLIIPSGKNSDQTLVAFICLRDKSAAIDTVSAMVPSLQRELRNHLPEFMVPRMFYPIERFPYNASRKLDRKVLREFGSNLTVNELLRYSTSMKNGAVIELLPVLSPIETWLQKLWGEILNIKPESIKLDDNFFALGGSSLAVLQLIASARDQGYLVTYTDMFKMPSLKEVAEKVVRMTDEEIPVIKPFTLIPLASREEVVRDAIEQCRVTHMDIQDVFPLTPQQEGLWALSLASNGSYVAQFSIQLQKGVDVKRFRAAWDKAVETISFMRTRIIQSTTGAYQVILRQASQWKESRSMEDYIRKDRLEPLDFGEEPTRYAFVGKDTIAENDVSSSRIMIWTSHHALYDGHSIPLFLNTVAKGYRGESIGPEIPFSRFIRHLMEADEEVIKHYWISRYRGRRSVNFPKIPYPTYRPVPTGVYTRSISFTKPDKSCVTDANVIRAALALTISQVTGASDVNYLETLDGRSIPVPGVESIIGPTFNTIPRNTRINGADTIGHFLQQMQSTSAELMAYAQYGLQKIRLLSEECAIACQFQSILVIEPTYCVEYTDVFEFDESGGGIHLFNSDCIMWKCNMHEKGVDLTVCYDGNVINDKQMRTLVNALEENIYVLCDKNQLLTISAIDSAPGLSNSAQKMVVRSITSSQALNGHGNSINGNLDDISKSLKESWLNTLDISIDEFNIDDDFFSKGGNSIRAMEFVAAARRSGVSISVAKIFRNPIFKDLARVANPTDKVASTLFSPTLMNPTQKAEEIAKLAEAQCVVNLTDVEEVLPATPLQAEFMASSQRKPGAWMAQTRYTALEGISTEQFRGMWEQLYRSFKILRSRIIRTNTNETFQVVIKAPMKWAASDNISEFLRADRNTAMAYGDSLTRYTMNTTSPRAQVIVTIHHAMYDGFTLDKLLQSLNGLMQGIPPPPAPSFGPFIHYLQSLNQEANRDFWQAYLSDYSVKQSYPLRLVDSTYVPHADTTREISIKLPLRRCWSSITLPTIMLAAWAKLINQRTGDADVVFGTRVSGRSAPVDGIMDMLEPTIAHVPVRVRLPTSLTAANDDIPVGKFLQDLQSAQSDMIAHEQAGLSKIATYGEGCRAACAFRNMLVIQRPADSGVGEIERLFEVREEVQDYMYFNDWALLLDVFPSEAGGSARLVFCYDSSVLTDAQVEDIARDFEGWIDALAVGHDATIGRLRLDNGSAKGA